ncbi:uncharacterized protein LOC100206592 [Hydra vulgaris]|uniref:uncharacterized protein LOC100206592 n=1 Tax=Hydra vulgaris TaxID=6087 RepID=UPI0001924DDF|nr:uncharacterized protein LOC100206592 [Hydra vulgaris]
MAVAIHSNNDQDLLTAAISSLIGISLSSPTDYKDSMPKVSLFDCHNQTYSYGKVGSTSPDSQIHPDSQLATKATKNIEEIKKGRTEFLIFVKTISGKTLTCLIDQNSTVLDVKKIIEAKTSIPCSQQRLIFAGKQLENERKTSDYSIKKEDTIHLIQNLRGGGLQFLDPSSLDPRYNYDFTNVTDENKIFTRGGEKYVRPCGWKRFAIKVSDRYENLTWLGSTDVPGEWPVSYHGTGVNEAKSIAEDGYNLTKGKRFAFGRGVYSTPNIKVAEKYALNFMHKNKQYAVVLQNRVNPTTLLKISADHTKIGEYWISPSDKDIRPYGVCIRKL